MPPSGKNFIVHEHRLPTFGRLLFQLRGHVKADSPASFILMFSGQKTLILAEVLYSWRVAKGYVQAGSSGRRNVVCNPCERCDCSFQRCDIRLRLKLGSKHLPRAAMQLRVGRANLMFRLTRKRG